MRCSLVMAVAVLAVLAMAVPARACGFEDPNSAPAQRVMLNLLYPNALHILGAVDMALRGGSLRLDHLSMPRDPFAFHRTASNLRNFADRFAEGTPSDLPEFSMVLMGPVLWTRFHPGSDVIVADVHADGPLAGDVVIVTDVPVLAALVSGDISGANADAAGLVRFYGNAAEIDILRKALVIVFPAGSDQNSRAQARDALPSAK